MLRIKTFIFFITFLSFSINYISGQSNADKLFAEAEALASERAYKESNLLYEDALSIYFTNKNWIKYYETKYAICYNYIDLFEFETAKIEIEKAISHFEENQPDEFHIIHPKLYHAAGKAYLESHAYEQAITNNRIALKYYQKVEDEKERIKYRSFMLNNIGAVYQRKRQLDSALYYYERALPLKMDALGKNANSTLRTIKSISGIYQDWGMLDKAIETQTIALKGAIEEGNKDAEAKAYNGLSQMYQRKRDFETSKLYISKSMEIYKNMENTFEINVAHSYHQMGNVLETEKAHKESLEWYTTAKNMYRKIHNGKYSYQEGNSTMNLGKAHNYMAQQLEATSSDIDATHPDVRALREKAIEYYEENEKIFAASVSKDHARWIELWLSKGVCLIEHLDTLGAHQLFQKAYDRAYKVAPDKSYDRSLSCLNLARTTKDTDKAIDLYQQGLWELSNGWEYSSLDHNPNAEQVFYENWSIEILRNKAEKIKQKSQFEEHPILLGSAIKSINAADDLLDESRASFLTTSAKIFLGEMGHGIYSKGIEICEQMTNQEEQAFYYMEKDKGLSLLEALQSGKRIQHTMIPDSISVKLRRVSSKIDELTATQNQFKNNKKYIDLGAEIFDLQEERKAIQTYIKEKYPLTNKIKNQVENISLKNVQNQLKDNEILYENTYTESYLFILKIGKNQSKLYKVKTHEYEEDLEDLLELISDENIAINNSNSPEVYQKFTQLSRKLFNKLLPDYNSEDLLIIPDGELSYLPFGLLLKEAVESKDVNYGALPYLLKFATIKYAFSSTLHFASLEQEETPKNALLAIAPEYPPNPTGLIASRAGFSSLIHTEKEAVQVSKLMNGEYLLGKDATVETFKTKVKDFNVLHLAMHAYTHEEDPMLSGMIFSETDTDNILHAYELYNMSIPSELVVLSACNTGLGQYKKGEGVMSLGRAFRHAGTRNIVMSLWQANDESTNKVMTKFYEKLDEGLDKAKALREAKLNYLATESKTHPYFWSSFVYLGTDSPLEFEKKFPYKNIALIAIVALLLLLGINRAKSKS